MTANKTYNSLSGSFRLTTREHGAVAYLRYRARMNIAHIAEVLGRSVATVHRVLSTIPDRLDHRGQTRTQCANRARIFAARRLEIVMRVRLWLEGTVDSMLEAFQVRMVPVVSENWAQGEEDDPA